MRSINRYELLEPITTGPVEVFASRERDTSLRRLLYVMPAPAISAEPTIREVLQLFRSLAPDPPGLTVDAGRDPETGSVYLVTSFPSDPTAMQNWVHAYRALSAKEQEAQQSVSSMCTVLLDQADTKPTTDVGPPGEFTRIFSERGSTDSPGAREPSTPTREFSANDQPVSRTGAESSPGEFTRFFRPGAAEMSRQPSPTLPDGLAPPESTAPGEFTRVFGSPAHSRGATSEKSVSEGISFFEASPIEEPGTPSGQLRPRAGQRHNAERAVPPQELSARGSGASVAGPFAERTSSPSPPGPASSSPARPGGIPEPIWDKPERREATKVLMPPTEAQARDPAPMSSGPSEYTRIVSGRIQATPPPEPAAPQPPALPSISAQAAPVAPVIPPPQIVLPESPSAPRPAYQPPTASPLAATPPVAQARKIPPAPSANVGKPVSYLPLIIILNVVFLAAVALVLYFALKPH